MAADGQGGGVDPHSSVLGTCVRVCVRSVRTFVRSYVRPFVRSCVLVSAKWILFNGLRMTR